MENCHDTRLGAAFGLTFTEDKSLRVSVFRNQPYVTFCEKYRSHDGDEFTKHISLSKLDWTALKARQEDIDRVLNYDVIHRDANDVWYLHEGQLIKSVQKRLVPRMCTKTFVLQLWVYRLTQSINATLKKNCYGCLMGRDDEQAHTVDGFGCRADWESIVRAQLTDAIADVNLPLSVRAINEKMKWNLQLVDYPNRSELFDVMVDHKALKTCKPCTELLPIYWDLYRFVFDESLDMPC